MVDSWLRAIQEQVVDGSAPSDLAAVRSGLRARVVPRMQPEVAAVVVHSNFTDELDIVAVVDYPDRTLRVTRDMLASTEQGRDVVQEAIAATVSAELLDLDIRDHDVTPEDSVRVVAKDGNPYVATALLLVSRLLPGPAPYGALVAAPKGSTIMLYLISSDRALGFLQTFDRFARNLASAAEDALVGQVYWWFEQVFHPVGVSSDGSSLSLPPALQDLVRSLPPAAG